MRNTITALMVGAAASFLGAGASADGLPDTIAWTAYDVGSSGYGQAIAIGAALKNERNVTLRVLPGKNDVSRLAPLTAQKVEFSAFGIGSYHATEGVFTFGRQEWGPQQLHLVAMSNGAACNTMIIAGDIGVKTYADLRGKRIVYVKGSPALNHNVYAFLRFAGLEWDDVDRIEFGGYGASLNAIAENRADGGITNSTSGFATKIFASPRGGMYPPASHDDEAGWKRLKEVAPYMSPAICSEAAGIDEPFEAADHPYPVLIALEEQEADLVYEMSKAMFELYPAYQGSAPGIDGWALDKQLFDWVIPYHDGAIRYFTEVGIWSDEYQAHNDHVKRRQTVLANAWNDYAANAPSDENEFAAGWQKARQEALADAEMNPVFTTW